MRGLNEIHTRHRPINGTRDSQKQAANDKSLKAYWIQLWTKRLSCIREQWQW